MKKAPLGLFSSSFILMDTVRTVTQGGMLGGGDFASCLQAQNTTACPLRAVAVYPVYRGRRTPAPRPPLGAEG